jgi:putative hydrolase of the HAD superfamily
MSQIKSIGFDLFDTLIVVENFALPRSVSTLVEKLQKVGIPVEENEFAPVYVEAAKKIVTEAKQTGHETHNSFWISGALHKLNVPISPDDDRLREAIDAYFVEFLSHARLIPQVIETLNQLKQKYKLGLLSNFTHAPAAKKFITHLNLSSLFDTIIISGELGYRKPHPFTYNTLIEKLGVTVEEIIYVGDNLEDDVEGAETEGISTIWMDHDLLKGCEPTYRIFTKNTTGETEGTRRAKNWSELISLIEKMDS